MASQVKDNEKEKY